MGAIRYRCVEERLEIPSAMARWEWFVRELEHRGGSVFSRYAFVEDTKNPEIMPSEFIATFNGVEPGALEHEVCAGMAAAFGPTTEIYFPSEAYGELDSDFVERGRLLTRTVKDAMWAHLDSPGPRD
jgi:hypothetical protein